MRDDTRDIAAMAGAGCLVLIVNLLWIAAVVAVIALIVKAVAL